MKSKLFDYVIVFCTWSIWSIWITLTMVLFMSGEAIFIIPTLFIAIMFTHLIISLKKRTPLLKISQSLIWYICFSLFSYLGAESVQAKPFFPLLCITFSLSGLLHPVKSPADYGRLRISIWLFCIALVFYFGLWPIGLIAIGVSILISELLSVKRKQAKHLAQKVPLPAQEAVKQDDVTNVFQPTFQVPGQQYQPLLPEYNRSFGSYIQDLPSDK